jgi:hypothetical protein
MRTSCGWLHLPFLISEISAICLGVSEFRYLPMIVDDIEKTDKIKVD